MADSERAVNLESFRLILRKLSTVQIVFLSECRERHNFNRTPPHLKVQVIGFYMYLRDSTYHIVKEAPPADTIPSLYDVIVSDGKEKLKCHFICNLNHFIEKGYLTIGTIINIKEACLKQSCVVVNDFDIVGHEPIPDPSTLSFMPSNNPKEFNPVPLFAKRCYYLHPWLTTLPYEPNLDTPVRRLTTKESGVDGSVLLPMTLKQLGKDAKRLQLPYPKMGLTILAQGRLHHYGKIGADKEFPFMGYLILADDTASCRAIMWDKRLQGTWNSIKVGDILLLQNYRVSVPRIMERKGSVVGSHKELPFLEQELHINERSLICILTEEEFVNATSPRNVRFPKTAYRFASRHLLPHLPSHSLVDVVGLVTYVGHFIRERFPEKKGVFHTFRWIEMWDESSPLPFRIQLFLGSQLKEQERILPGTIVICTHLRLIHPYRLATSRDEKPVILTTTSESALALIDLPVAGMCKRVRRLMFWLENHLDRESLTCRVGGFLLPYSDENSPGLVENESILMPENWKTEIEQLTLREHKLVRLPGKITSVQLLRINKDSQITKQLIFVDIRKRSCTPLVGVQWNLAFPRLVSLSRMDVELLKRWLLLPSFCAQRRKTVPLTGRDHMAFSLAATDAYIINISSEDGLVSISTLFFGKSSKKPHPSLRKLLKGEYEGIESEDRNQLIAYTADEIETVINSQSEIDNKKFVFLVDLFCYETSKNVAILRTALET